jgi:hypothetical protein
MLAGPATAYAGADYDARGGRGVAADRHRNSTAAVAHDPANGHAFGAGGRAD